MVFMGHSLAGIPCYILTHAPSSQFAANSLFRHPLFQPATKATAVMFYLDNAY